MDKANVIALRKELRHLEDVERKNSDKKIDVPLIIAIDHANTIIDEANSCIIWDDEKEILYSLELNNDVNDKFYDVCYMRVRAFEYSSIKSITARVDMLMTMNFFDDKISKNQTNESTKEKYHKFFMDRRDPKTYAAGAPSPTTMKETPIETFNEETPLINPKSIICP